jgi:hypothetical protein
MGETLKEVFIKHSMAAIEGCDKEKSIFGIGDDKKFNICYNYLVPAYLKETYVNEESPPPISMCEFANDSKTALEILGIKNITGEFKIYVDDGNVLVIEGGKVTLK